MLEENRRRRPREFIALFRVKPGARVKLSTDFDPAFKGGIKKEDEVAFVEAAGDVPAQAGG